MREQNLKVGMSDIKVCKAPISLITFGLGSCIGVALYDKKNKVGGMAHIMLPTSKAFPNVTKKLKFVDLAVPILISEMEKIGANKKSIVAKIAGGAAMFEFNSNTSLGKIGENNIQEVKKVLKEHYIRIVAQDIGGKKARTISLNTENGILKVKTVGEESYEL